MNVRPPKSLVVASQMNLAEATVTDGCSSRLQVAADGRVGAVGPDDEVVVAGQAQRIGHVVLETEVDAGAGRLLVQEAQQCHAGDGGHAVAAAAPLLAVDADFDLVPVDAVVGQRPQQHRILVVDPSERGVGEDHPEPEGVLRAVALENDDLGGRVGQLQQRGGEEPPGPPTDDGDSHGVNIT